MKRKPLPTADRLRALFSYDRDSGVLSWNVARQGLKTGDVAGWLSRYGYRCVTVDYLSYQAHNIIWKLVTGRDPNPELDHINRIRDDNRWDNLRECTHSENCTNKSVHGYVGQPRLRGQFAPHPK